MSMPEPALLGTPRQRHPGLGALRTLPGLIATAGGIGCLRPGPGTWGSLATALVAWPLLPVLPWPVLVLATMAISLVGVWASSCEAKRCGVDDPSWVVIDEVAGVLVGLSLIPPTVSSATPLPCVVLVFLAFRVYDIAKPWPLSRLETLPGGWGVMADDLAAGAIAGLLTTALLR